MPYEPEHRPKPVIKFTDHKGGFPHSEIFGSKGARASPKLIAACHVLHRLSMPRHPSEALMRLIVLSKTHAWGRFVTERYEPSSTPTHALCLCQTINDVFSGIPKRETLPFTMSFDPDRRCASVQETWCPSDRTLARWWSQTGSNRRPHACKARALPTELWPPVLIQGPGGVVFSRSVARAAQGRWWAQADSNRRPHAYQACALTS
jgi:hypothetical protein